MTNFRILYFLLCTSFIFISKVYGQEQSKIDSIHTLLESKSISKNDSLNAYLDLMKLLYRQYPDSAFNYSDKAISLAMELDETPLLINAYINKAYQYNFEAKYDEAIIKLNLADSLSQVLNSNKATDEEVQRTRLIIFQNKAVSFHYLNEIERSIKNTLKSLEISELLNDSINQSIMHYNLAYAHFSLNNIPRTKKYLNRAMQIARELNYKTIISGSLILKCNILSSENDLDSIKVFASEAIKLSKESNNFKMQIEASTTLGNVYVLEDSLILGEQFLLKVLDDARSINSAVHEANALVGLGRVNNKLGRYEDAQKYFLEYFEIDKKLDYTKLRHEALYEFSELENNVGNYKHANELLEEYYIIKDSIFTEESRRITSDLDAKYEAAKKDIELANQQITIKQNVNQRNIFLGGALFSLLLAGFFWNSKSKSDKIYTQQIEIDRQKITQLEKEKKIFAMNALIEGQEEERLRIAKDLHDGLGGLLSTVKARLSNINAEVEKIESYNIYQKTTNMVDEACEEVRRISHNLLPGALRLDGLKTAIEQLGEDLSKSHNLNVNVEVIGFEGKIDETKEIFIYRIVQEAMNNIIKHAEAKQVLLQLSETDEDYHIIVEDDGQGFDTTNKSPGIGLKSIKSRVEHLQGDVDISSITNKGTTISIHVPKLS